MFYNYIVTSGWWATKKSQDNRAVLLGDDQLRTTDFHEVWFSAINRFCNPKEIIIIDSASPLKPAVCSKEKWIEMSKNFGHSTNHIGKYSGVMRSFIMSLTYCYINDYDYWVYIEQDCLIYGDNIVEKAIKQMRHAVMFGDGTGTPQPTQQSFMIIKRSAIPKFIYRLEKIDTTDNEVSPEIKFLLATSFLVDLIPRHLMRLIIKRLTRIKGKLFFLRHIFFFCYKLFCCYDKLPFGSGRARPIPFSEPFFYFQHGDSNELKAYMDKLSQFD